MAELGVQLRLMADLWRVERVGPPILARRQEQRLRALLSFARERSPLYRDLYRSLPSQIRSLSDLPPVSKPELMARFDDWVTDRDVGRSGVADFVKDPSRVGDLYLGRYAVCRTSGVTGVPGIYLEDRAVLRLDIALRFWRGTRRWLKPPIVARIARDGYRLACVLTVGGHFGGLAATQRARRRLPWLAEQMRSYSIFDPIGDLTRALQDFQPTVLAGYSTAMVLLATEQAAGRLALRPTVVLPGGECLSAADRAAIEAAFGCPVYESYGTAELGMVAYGCRAGWLHVNADWTILEPVDDDYRPVPPGQPSHTVLATNLANRIQPIIRYDQGDSITVRPDPCPCGSRLPAILVEGRHYETLFFDASDGHVVPLLPQAVLGTVTATPGVERAQVVQTSPTALRVRFEARPGFDDGSVWDAIAGRLGRFFSEHGVGGTQLIRSTEPPIRDPVSGKLPRIVSYARSAVR